MNDTVFHATIRRVYGRFNKRLPHQDVIDDAWEDLKGIPDESVPWILERIRALDKMPDNWALEFKRLWHSWRTVHPEKCAYEGAKPKKDCPYCDQGELYSAVEKNGLWYPSSSPCGHCSPFVPGSVTVASLQARGHVVIEPYMGDNKQTFGQAPATFAWVREQNRPLVTHIPGARNLPLRAVKSAMENANREWDESRSPELVTA